MRAPYYDFTFNKFTLDELNLRPLIESVTFTENLGKFDTLEMVIEGADELGCIPEITKLGSTIQFSGGYYNESILPFSVLFLHAYNPDFATRKVTLSFMGYLRAMDATERDRTLANKSIEEIVTEVVADYETLEVGTIDSGDIVISDTTTQSKTTDFKLLESIASDFGMHWKVDVIPGVAGKWSLSLIKMEYDKNDAENHLPLTIYPEKEYQAITKSVPLASFSPKANILGVSSRVEIRSNNPDQPIVVATDTKDPTKNPREVSGSDIVATVFGSVTRIHFYENLSNEEAAAIIADQLRQTDELSFVIADGSQCLEGIPNLRMGQTREVICKGIPMFEKMFSGNYFITGTTHKWGASTGYDTSFNSNMNCLSIPVPEQTGFGSGGSGGTPVLIRVLQSGEKFGWYVSQDGSGTIVSGTPISHEEIMSNSYWMEHVNISIGYYIDTSASTIVGTPYVGQSAVPGATDWTNLARAGMQLPGEYVDVRIDWPSSWNTGLGGSSLATSAITSAATNVIESVVGGVLSGFSDVFLQNTEAGTYGCLPSQYAEVISGSALGIAGVVGDLARNQGGGL